MGGSILSGIPYTWDEGLIILASVFVLLFVVIILSFIKKIRIGKEFTYAILKGGVQLTIIALFLTYLFKFELWYLLIWLLLVTMIIVGGYTSAKRATGMPQAYYITTPAILIGSTIVLVILAISKQCQWNLNLSYPLQVWLLEIPWLFVQFLLIG